jgi:hypothetical protein
MALSFRDRFLTPPVARAILSPLGMVLFGVGAAGGILLGAPLAVAAVAGAAGWGAQVLAAVPRGRTTARVEPFALSEPWRTYVVEAQVSKKRFDNVVSGMAKGPTRDRLAAMDERLDDGIDESWKIAKRGHDISQALSGLSTKNAERDLADIRFGIGANRPPTESETSLIEALQSQIDAANRLETTAGQAMDRLRVLDARFDELVARAIEVSVGAGDSDLLRNDVNGLVTELEALRMAIEETSVADGQTLPGVGLPGTGLTSPG